MRIEQIYNVNISAFQCIAAASSSSVLFWLYLLSENNNNNNNHNMCSTVGKINYFISNAK